MDKFTDSPRTSCALGGALAAIAALPDVIPIVHASGGCAGNLASAISIGAGYLGASYCSGNAVPTSAIKETEVVFGGNDRLREQIESTLKLIDGKIYIVATGCMTEIIGDDVGGVVGEFSKDNVIHLNTPSFRGDNYLGYEILLDGIFNNWLPKSEKTDAKLINVFGIVPAYDPFFRGDLEEIERLGAKLGLKVNTFFSSSQTFENITSAGDAALNIIFSRTRCHDFAQNFESKHGTPFWVTDLPIGPEATDNFLRELAAKLKLENVESVITEENRWYYRYFERTVDIYTDQDLRSYSVTVTNSNYALPLNKFLHRELGWEPADIFITDKLDDEQKEAVLKGFSEFPVKPQFESGSSDISKAISLNHPEYQGQRYFNSLTPLYIVGSTNEKKTAIKRQAAGYLAVSFPVFDRPIVSKGYAGYGGGLRLYEDLIHSFMSMKG